MNKQSIIEQLDNKVIINIPTEWNLDEIFDIIINKYNINLEPKYSHSRYGDKTKGFWIRPYNDLQEREYTTMDRGHYRSLRKNFIEYKDAMKILKSKPIKRKLKQY